MATQESSRGTRTANALSASSGTRTVNALCASSERVALLQGTLDLLILRTLVFGAQHGQGIARAIQRESEDVLLVDHGTLYPALQRLERKGWIRAEWGTSTNNRRARFYTLTRSGRGQLTRETDQWRKVAVAIGRILGSET